MKGKGNEDLISWIARGLDPSIHFQIEELEILGKKIVIFDIIPSLDRPVEFYGVAFIRVGSYKKPLKNYPEKARILWQRSGSKFEQGIAKENLTQEEVFSLLDWKRYFILLNEDIPQNTEAIIERFVQE